MKKIIILSSIILGTSLLLNTDTMASTAVDSNIDLKADMAKLDQASKDTHRWLLEKIHTFARQGWALEKNIEKLKAKDPVANASKIKALEAENAKITEVRQALGQALKSF